jgi:DUF971 family protein
VHSSSEPKTFTITRDVGLEIDFVDGHVETIDLMSLRLRCPCATCRTARDRGEEGWPLPGSPQPLRIQDAKLQGSYALNIVWNDGHRTGIFPFDLLRRWSDFNADD